MRIRPHLAATAVVALSALSVSDAPAALAADSLGIHEKHAIAIKLYSLTCADCDLAPNMKTAVWRFASDFKAGASVTGFAYTLVSYRQVDGAKQAALFGFEAYAGRWRLLGRSLDGSNRLVCSTDLMLNKNYALDRQLRLIKKLVRCSP